MNARVLLAFFCSLVFAPLVAVADGPLALSDVPPAARPLDPARLDAAHALAQAQRDIAGGDYASAESALARAKGAEALRDYVALFEARLLLAKGQSSDAAKAAREGSEQHRGRPIATAFSELLGEAQLAEGDPESARRSWELAAAATKNADRRADLEQRIVAMLPSQETTVADATGIPSEVMRQLEASRSAREHLREADKLMSRGLSADAIAAYDTALKAGLEAADAKRARLQRGHALFRIRRYKEATVAFASLLPEAEARFWRARSLARAGDIATAITEFEAIGASEDAKRAAWALYLAATLLEDRGETARATALYEEVAERDPSARGIDALWRVAWSTHARGDFARARSLFLKMTERMEPLDALRPRYWAARAAEEAGDSNTAATEFRRLIAAFPLSYYGWRAGERLGADLARASTRQVSPGRSDVDPRDVERIELLIEADLDDFAQEELGALSSQVRGLEDRKSVGRLYVRTGDFHRAQRLVVDAYAESLSRGVDPGNEVLWWLSWPPAYRQIVDRVFPKNAVIEPALVWAIMREESSYRPWITSSAGARGLLQIMPATGQQLARRNGYPNFDPDDLYTPQVNIALGSAYLNELGRRFDGRLSAAIGSYNAGPRAVNRWLVGDQAKREDDAWVEDIPYDQTRTYVKRVLRSLHVYRTMYGELQPPAAQRGG